MGAVKAGYGPKEPKGFKSDCSCGHNPDDPSLVMQAQRELCRACQTEREAVCCQVYQDLETGKFEPCEIFAQAMEARRDGIPSSGRFAYPVKERIPHQHELVNPCAYCSQLNLTCKGHVLKPQDVSKAGDRCLVAR